MLGWLRRFMVLVVVTTACSASEPPQAATDAAVATDSKATTTPTTTTVPTTTPVLPTTTVPTTTPVLPTTVPTTSIASPVTLPAVEPYEPSPSDVQIGLKRLAGRFIQTLLTYSATDTPEDVTRKLISEYQPQVTDGLDSLVAEVVKLGAPSVGSIVYGQMGGLRLESASVMVQAKQERLTPEQGEVAVETRVFDVRLAQIDGTWRIDVLASNGGPRVSRPADLSPTAVRVLDHPNISMADSSRWDIYRGHTTEEMLFRMAEIADTVEIGVLVLSSGHPFNVFATEKVSRHSVGNAMDVFSVAGQLVVDSRFEGSPAWDLTNRLFDAETRSIGSPWSLDGIGGRSFSDLVHQDHLHIIAN